MSAQPALVSVLVPAYNAAKYLPELCRSIQAQTYPHFEALIGNDGSTDDTISVLAPFLRDNRFRLLNWQPNRGAHQAWTLLCNEAKGDYWCAPGADDALYPTFLAKRVEMLETHPEAFMVHGLPELIDENGRPPQKTYQLLPELPARLGAPRSLEVLLENNVINTPSVMVRTSVTKQLLPFMHWNWGFTNDWFSWILHASTIFDVLWDPQPQSKYRIHATSLSWSPEKHAVRRAEVRLTPMVALRTASAYSHWAALTWARWGRTMYWRWLRQAAALKVKGGLRPEWTQLAAHAYYGGRRRHVFLWLEVAKHLPGILLADLRHRQAQARQSFIVSGLAEIEDPIFR